jgi:hypothetical protein
MLAKPSSERGTSAKARKDLGDDHPDHKTEGKNTRPAGYVENAVILHGKPD